MRLASVYSFTQVIKSCWRGRQGCSVSPGSFAAPYETGSTNTKAHMCSHLKICSHFPYTSFLSFFLSFSKPPSFFVPFLCLLIFVCFSLSHARPIPQLSPLSLSLSLSIRLLLLSPFYLILSSPLRYSSFSFPQEEPQSYLGYVGFDELKSHFTNSLSASPENSALSKTVSPFARLCPLECCSSGNFFTPHGLLMLILYLTLHLPDSHPLLSLLFPSLCFFSALKCLIYSY